MKTKLAHTKAATTEKESWCFRIPGAKYILPLLLLLAAPAAHAQFLYTTNNGAVTITGYTGSSGVVMIPRTIDSLSVVSIGDWAFYATSVTNVLIPDSVTNIGNGVFFDCISLTNVTLGSGVSAVGDWTFGFCTNLTSVSCRGNAPSLGGANVFYDNNQATIYYLTGTTGWGAALDAHPAVLWNPPVPFSYTTNSDGITLTLGGYTGSSNLVMIPSAINFLPVVGIGNNAFYEDISLDSVTIPDGVTNIAESAFYACGNLTNATIPASVTSIGGAPFPECPVVINVDTNSHAFVVVGGILFDYDQTILIECSESTAPTSYVVPGSVTNIGDYAFADCRSLTNIIIGNNVTRLGNYAFQGCSLTSLTIPNGVTSIGDYAFGGCGNLANIIIGSSVTRIGNYAFQYCSLTNLTIPDGVTSIGDYAFEYNDSLTSITIPASVTSIGAAPFADCSSLVAINVDADNLAYASVSGVLFNYDLTALINYPAGSADTSYTVRNSVVVIGDSAFAGCGSLSNIILGTNITTIGDHAFSGSIFLGDPITSLTIPNSVTNIGDYAFSGCHSLTNITIGNSVVSIGAWAFFRCEGLASLVIPTSVTVIGDYAFSSCSDLTNVTILNSPASIGNDAFAFCDNLATVALGDGLTSIGDYAFAGGGEPYNRQFASIIIPDSVTNIGNFAFRSQAFLTNVIIGTNVTSIGYHAFSGCDSLTSVVIPTSVTTLRDWAFGPYLTSAYFQGNAPRDDGDPFQAYGYLTVYYLPGTTGWGSTFGGAPTALWLPQVQTSDASFGVRTNRFGFNINWASGQTVVVEAATNLSNPVWVPVGTNTLTAATSYFSDPGWINYPKRFYRLRSP